LKYISFIDQLGIDINQLAHIDSNGIIKLQKQLKAKAMLGDANNLGELSNLIENLKDDTTRQSHVFVEKHQWLKHLISGDYKYLKQNEINVDDSQINNIENLKYFLAPFLKENLKVFLSESLNKGKYVLILKVLLHNNLFSEENNQLVINFLKARLNYAAVYLRELRLKEKEYPVSFITNKVFINCLNEYPDCFNVEMQELNSEVIEIYNTKRRNVDNQEFKFAAKAMVAFSILDTSNVFLEETLTSNAEIAKEYTYPSRSSKKTGSGFGGWSIFVIIMIVLRIVFWIGKSSSSNTNSYDFEYLNTDDYSNGSNPMYNDEFIRVIDSIQRLQGDGDGDGLEIEETVIESALSNRYKLSNHIKFIYTLKLKVARKRIDDNGTLVLNPFSNPYPKTFNEIPNALNTNDNTLININNKSKKDLIVFRLTQGIDQSIYIPSNQNLALEITNNDSLVFYVGKEFLSARFSHFKKETDLTAMYKIQNTDASMKKEITIYPFKDKITRVNSTSSDKIIIDTTRTENIDTKNIDLKRLSINRIYTDYYNKKYRN